MRGDKCSKALDICRHQDDGSGHAGSAGVMCLDFHPQQANILAVGFHNGSIEVLDVLRKRSQPLYRATAASGKHGDAVTSIR